MATAGNDAADHRDAESDPPLTAELLADLQAGVLDDAAAARVRRRARRRARPRRVRSHQRRTAATSVPLVANANATSWV